MRVRVRVEGEEGERWRRAFAAAGHEVDPDRSVALDDACVVDARGGLEPIAAARAEGVFLTVVALVDAARLVEASGSDADVVCRIDVPDHPAPAVVAAVERMRLGDRAEQRWASTMMDHIEEGVVVHRDGVILYANPAMYRILGWSPAELLGRPLFDFVAPEFLAAAGPRLREVTDEPREVLALHRDGRRVEVETRGRDIPTREGRARVTIVRDLTRYREAERALRDSHHRYELVGRATKDLVYDWDCRSGSIVWNASLHDHWGYPPGTALDIEKWLALVHPDDRARIGESIEAALASSGEAWTGEYRFRHADGSWRDVIDRGLLMRDADGVAIRMIGVMTDTTERNHVQRQLVFAERMASIGEVAAGVVHEIKNPLTWLMGNLEMAREQVSALTPSARTAALAESIALATEGAARIRAIVRDIHLLARGAEEPPQPMDPRRAIEAALTVAGALLRPRAQVVRDLPAVGWVLANEGLLGQVFLNLVVNAAQAIPEGHPDDHRVTVVARDRGAWVELEVRDTGAGIPPELRERIFEPWVTTKQPGEGTGLGLAIVRQLVGRMGGRVELESEVGRGTTFRVVLPAVERPGEEAPGGSVASAPRRGRILVVEDEPMIVSWLARVIELDHEVLTFTDPVAALAELRAGQRFDVILCDLSMPEMSGTEFWTALSAEVPEQAQRVVFITGGAYTPRLRQELDAAGRPVVEKPFGVRALLEFLRERVDAG